MGSDALSCHLCRHPIQDDDLQAGRAVVVLRRHYCLKCSKRVAGDPSERLLRYLSEGPRPWMWGLVLLFTGVVLGAAAVSFWMSRRG
jgi:hypothetical protein